MSRIRIGALIASTAILVAACGGSTATQVPSSQAPSSQAPSSQAPATEAPSQPAEGTPKTGGTLVVGIEGDMVRSDMALVSDLNSSYVLQQVVEGLVSLAPGTGDEIVPALATDWTISDDSLTYTFNLREGVSFHDGTPVDATAVKYNFDRWLNFPQSYIDAGYTYYADTVIGHGETSLVESVSVVDANTVDIKLRNPNSAFLLQMTLTPFAIQSPTAIEAGNGNAADFAQNKYAVATKAPGAVGTGPFVFQEWVSGDHVTLTKNPSYWNAANGGPYLDSVTFRPLPDTTARLNDLTSGGIDLAQALAPVDVPSLTGDPDVSPIDRGSACNLGVIGMRPGPQAVRQPQDPPGGRSRDRPAGARGRVLRGRRHGRRQLDAARIAIREGSHLPDLRPRGRQGAHHRVGRRARGSLVRVLVPLQHDPRVHAGSEGTVRRHPDDARGRRLQAHPEDGRRGTRGYVDGWNKGDYAMWPGGWNCDWFGIDNFLYTAFFGYQRRRAEPLL